MELQILKTRSGRFVPVYVIPNDVVVKMADSRCNDDFIKDFTSRIEKVTLDRLGTKTIPMNFVISSVSPVGGFGESTVLHVMSTHETLSKKVHYKNISTTQGTQVLPFGQGMQIISTLIRSASILVRGNKKQKKHALNKVGELESEMYNRIDHSQPLYDQVCTPCYAYLIRDGELWERSDCFQGCLFDEMHQLTWDEKFVPFANTSSQRNDLWEAHHHAYGELRSKIGDKLDKFLNFVFVPADKARPFPGVFISDSEFFSAVMSLPLVVRNAAIFNEDSPVHHFANAMESYTSEWAGSLCRSRFREQPIAQYATMNPHLNVGSVLVRASGLSTDVSIYHKLAMTEIFVSTVAGADYLFDNITMSDDSFRVLQTENLFVSAPTWMSIDQNGILLDRTGGEAQLVSPIPGYSIKESIGMIQAVIELFGGSPFKQKAVCALMNLVTKFVDDPSVDVSSLSTLSAADLDFKTANLLNINFFPKEMFIVV